MVNIAYLTIHPSRILYTYIRKYTTVSSPVPASSSESRHAVLSDICYSEKYCVTLQKV